MRADTSVARMHYANSPKTNVLRQALRSKRLARDGFSAVIDPRFLRVGRGTAFADRLLRETPWPLRRHRIKCSLATLCGNGHQGQIRLDHGSWLCKPAVDTEEPMSGGDHARNQRESEADYRSIWGGQAKPEERVLDHIDVVELTRSMKSETSADSPSDERVRAYATPVTPDVLKLPLQTLG